MGLKFQYFFFIFFFFGDFFENFSILEVEIGRNGPGILGVKWRIQLHNDVKTIVKFNMHMILK
jgi:hypothetical protein